MQETTAQCEDGCVIKHLENAEMLCKFCRTLLFLQGKPQVNVKEDFLDCFFLNYFCVK